MNKKIYGVDLSKGVTPIIVRDAIIVCFEYAHKEILDMMDDYTRWESDEERKKFRNLKVKMLVKNAFKEANVDYDNPGKEELIRVIDRLAELASEFRKPEIIEKHYNEIKGLISMIKSPM